MNGVIKIVTIRSFVVVEGYGHPLRMVREQPKPNNKGIKDLPCKPHARITRSITKAARAI